MNRMFKQLWLCVAALLTLIACDNGYDCSLNNIAYNSIGLYRSNGNGDRYKLPEPLTVSLTVNGRDSIVVNHIQDTDNLMLPLSYANSCDTVILHFGDIATDTMYIAKENIPYYISMECGTVMYHRLTGAEHTKNFIDSAAIVNNYINFDNNENIRLYLAD